MTLVDPWIAHQDRRIQEWATAAQLGVKDHFVYRYYDGADLLLYVGMTTKPAQRAMSHRSQSKWYSQADRVEVDGPYTRTAAMYHEFRAICGDYGTTPPHNRQKSNGFTGPGSHEWLAADIEARHALRMSDPEFDAAWQDWQIENLGPEWADLFRMFGSRSLGIAS